jgi:hypothetical protein
MHSKGCGAARLRRPVLRSRAVSGDRFRQLRISVASQVDAATLLGVSLRTLRNWETRRRRVPYSAYRLLRILRNGELPDAAWRGWRVWGDTLWTPEGKALRASEAAWWSLLVRMARAFRRETRLSAGSGLQVGEAVGDGTVAMDGQLAVRSDSPPRSATTPHATLLNAVAEPLAGTLVGVAEQTSAQRSLLPGLVLFSTSGTLEGPDSVPDGPEERSGT